MKKSRKMLSLLCAALVVAGVGACGQNQQGSSAAPSPSAAAPAGSPAASGEVTLTYLGYGDEDTYKITQEAIRKFMEENPGVKVDNQFSPVSTWGDFANKMTARVGSGESVDLVGVAIEGTRLLQSKGLFEPLDDYMANDPDAKEMQEDIAPALFNAFRVDGKLYELPREWNSMVVVYNTKLFDEAGIPYPSADWTWQEFAEIAQKLTTGEGENKVWGFANNYGPIQTMPWLITNGTSILDENMANSILDRPEATEAMQFANDLIYKYQCTPALEKGTDVIQLFAAGRIAMVGGWQGLFPAFKNSSFTDYDVQVWPANKPDAPRTIIGIGGIGISSSSANKDLSWELLKELVSKETVQKMADLGAAIPVRKSAGTSETFLSFSPNAKIMYEGAYDGIQMPAPANFPEMEQIFMRNFDVMMNAQMDVSGQMGALHTELQAAMDELKG